MQKMLFFNPLKIRFCPNNNVSRVRNMNRLDILRIFTLKSVTFAAWIIFRTVKTCQNDYFWVLFRLIYYSMVIFGTADTFPRHDWNFQLGKWSWEALSNFAIFQLRCFLLPFSTKHILYCDVYGMWHICDIYLRW